MYVGSCTMARSIDPRLIDEVSPAGKNLILVTPGQRDEPGGDPLG